MKGSNAISLVQIASALLIVNYHTGKLEAPLISQIAKFGFLFNTIFVFLSGYLLAKSLEVNRSISFREFLERRLSRIFPSFHVSVIVILIIYWITGREVTVASIVSTLTGLQYFWGENTFGSHLWYVSVILVCYFLCIPTYRILKSNPAVLFVTIIGSSAAIALFREGAFYGIYNKISGEVIYRFLYHYIIFAGGLWAGIKYLNLEIFTRRTSCVLFVTCFSAYVFSHARPEFGIITVSFAAIVALCSISLLSSFYPYVARSFPQVFLLSSCTYELYLVHYSVIDAIDTVWHGAILSYPAVFAISISLAVVISKVSHQYSLVIAWLSKWRWVLRPSRAR